MPIRRVLEGTPGPHQQVLAQVWANQLHAQDGSPSRVKPTGSVIVGRPDMLKGAVNRISSKR